MSANLSDQELEYIMEMIETAEKLSETWSPSKCLLNHLYNLYKLRDQMILSWVKDQYLPIEAHFHLHENII